MMSGPSSEKRGLLRPGGARLLRSIPLRFARKQKHGSKRSVYAELNLTSMVDMLTILVVFLLQTFSASGELLQQKPNLEIATVSYGDANAAPQGMAISISQQTIYVEDCLVGSRELIDNPALTAQATQRTRDCITTVEEKMRTMGNAPKDAAKKLVVFQVDKHVEYGALIPLKSAVMQAGYAIFKYPVIQGPGAAQ